MYALVIPPSHFSPIATSANICLTRNKGSEHPAETSVRHEVAEIKLRCDVSQSSGGDVAVVHSVVATRAQLQDAGFAALCEAFTKNSLLLCSRLSLLDLSFCDLTVGSWTRLKPLLQGGVELPTLRTLLLVGNFRDDDATKMTMCVHLENSWTVNAFEQRDNVPPVAAGMTGLVDEIAEVWDTHPALSVVSLDPWLTSRSYEAVKRRKRTKERETLMRQTIASITASNQSALPRTNRMSAVRASANVVGVDGGDFAGGNRKSMMLLFSQEEVSKDLMEAAVKSQAEQQQQQQWSGDTATADGGTTTDDERNRGIVELQLMEHRRRSRVVDTELTERIAIQKSAGTSSGILAEQQTRRSKATRAMEELEDEVRGMIIRREEDAIRKINMKFSDLKRYR